MATMMPGAVQRLQVREVRPSLIESLPAMVILAPRNNGRGPHLSLRISNRDAHALVHELAGRVTLRHESLQFASRLAGSLGCALEAVRLHSIAPGVIRASVQCTHAGHVIDVPAEPCQCLTLAIVNDLPILFDGEIEHDPDESPLNQLVSVDHAAGF
jgi:bifunctional DNase/RNase